MYAWQPSLCRIVTIFNKRLYVSLSKYWNISDDMDIPRPKKKIALTAAERKAISRANQSEEAKEKEKSRNREDKKTPEAMARHVHLGPL